MRPILNNERELLKEHFNIEIPKDSWNNDSYVMQFNQDKEKIALGRLVVERENIIFQKSKDYKEIADPLPHEQLSKEYKMKLHQAIQITKRFFSQYKGYRVLLLDSTGKDSRGAAYVLQKANIKFEKVFINSSMESHHTLKMIKKDVDIIINPSFGFHQAIENRTIPTIRQRWCCTEFKKGLSNLYFSEEEKVIYVLGIRSEESKGRGQLDFSAAHTKWNKKQKENWLMFHPVYNFSDIDIWMLLLSKKIKVNNMYLLGFSRIGCVATCPFAGQLDTVYTRILLKTYYKRWQKILEKKFIEDEQWTVFNCTLKEYLEGAWKIGQKYRQEPTESVLREFMSHKGLKDIEVAKKFFNAKCEYCDKKLSTIDTSLSLKLLGRNIEKKLCIKCLAKFLNTTEKNLKEQAGMFKNEGCQLF